LRELVDWEGMCYKNVSGTAMVGSTCTTDSFTSLVQQIWTETGKYPNIMPQSEIDTTFKAAVDDEVIWRTTWDPIAQKRQDIIDNFN